jgi:hypothetical protein
MSTDVPEGPAPPPGRRPSRAGESGAPVSGALTIVLAIVAVVAGFLILRAITDDDDENGGSTTPTGTDDTTEGTTGGTAAPAQTTLPATTTTTTLPAVREGATVIVANSSNINGSAGQMSRTLEEAGYTLGEATNGTLGQLEVSRIYYDAANPAALAVAETLSRDLGGGVEIAVVETPPPIESGDLAGAGVLLLLGVDKAGKSLEELSTPATTAPSGVTAPSVAGSTSTTAG